MKSWLLTFYLALFLLPHEAKYQRMSSSWRNSPTFYRNNSKFQVLQVSTRNYEPFMYQNKSGKFFDGIEYKLIKTIVEKEHLNLLFHTEPRISSDNSSQELFGYDFNPIIFFIQNFGRIFCNRNLNGIFKIKSLDFKWKS